jgi:REP element-mobilizing transposase RayT
VQDIRAGRHVVFSLHVYLVFITKYRRRDVLSVLAVEGLAAIFTKVWHDFGAELKECSGEDDHVHLLVFYPPKVTLSKLVNSFNGVSSRLLRDQRPEMVDTKTALSGRRPSSPVHAAAPRLPPSPNTFATKKGPHLLPALKGGISGAGKEDEDPPPRSDF